MRLMAICTKHNFVLEGDLILSRDGSTFDADTSEMSCSPGWHELLQAVQDEDRANCTEYWEVVYIL